jgi:hypothetical protein
LDGSGTVRPCWIALIVVITFGFEGIGYFGSQMVPTFNESEAEWTLRSWLDHFHLSVTKMPSDADSDFVLLVTLRNNNHVIVRKTKVYGRYVTLQGGPLQPS